MLTDAEPRVIPVVLGALVKLNAPTVGDALLDAQPQFRTLGEDGCIEPALPVAETFPIVLHVVTAWTMQLFGLDPGTGLDASVAGSYSTPVDIEYWQIETV